MAYLRASCVLGASSKHSSSNHGRYVKNIKKQKISHSLLILKDWHRHMYKKENEHRVRIISNKIKIKSVTHKKLHRRVAQIEIDHALYGNQTYL